MFEIKVRENFEAAHRIAGYPGKCDRLHGHSWSVEAVVRGDVLDGLGMLVDFKDVKGVLKNILEEWDHRFINELPPFSEGKNPTAENMAEEIFRKMSEAEIFRRGNAGLHAVTVWESPHSSVTYYGE